jgi:hypothetical protein
MAVWRTYRTPGAPGLALGCTGYAPVGISLMAGKGNAGALSRQLCGRPRDGGGRGAQRDSASEGADGERHKQEGEQEEAEPGWSRRAVRDLRVVRELSRGA